MLVTSANETPPLTAFLVKVKPSTVYPFSASSLTTNIPSGKGNFSKSILSGILKNLFIKIALNSLALSYMSKLSHAIFPCAPS